MKVLVIGSGGREHAMIWKLKQSPKVRELFCAPGNGGICQLATCVDIKIEDIQGLVKYAAGNKIDLTIVGPEIPLVLGIVDEFRKAGLRIFGPTASAARLEGSKVFSKEFMRRYNIPTADFQVFDNAKSALDFLKVLSPKDFPIVIKADGLAAGKGVVIAPSLSEAQETIIQILDKGIFKEAGKKIIIEEFIKGEELSILAISDGESFVMLDSSQDHKRAFDDDLGPNTGGMGAYSPVPLVTDQVFQKISESVITPTIQGMKKDGSPFKGVLYAGLMLTNQGIKVLEYNVRFGDPEAQAVIPRLKNDLVDVLLAACDGNLSGLKLGWVKQSCICVVMASGGYPGSYESGKEIYGLDLIGNNSDTVVFHAGTKKMGRKYLTAGGRVLGVMSLGPSIEETIKKVYSNVEKITFEKCFYRRDIGFRALRKIKV